MHKVWPRMIKLHKLEEWGTSKLSKRAYLNAIKNSSDDWKVKNLLVQVCHGYEKLDKTMRGIEHNRVHWIVAFKIFIVHTLDVRQPRLYSLWLSHTKKITLKETWDPNFKKRGSQIFHFWNASGHSKSQHKNQKILPFPSNSKEIHRIPYLPCSIQFEMHAPTSRHLYWRRDGRHAWRSSAPSSLATSCACRGFHSNYTYVVGQLELSYQRIGYPWFR